MGRHETTARRTGAWDASQDARSKAIAEDGIEATGGRRSPHLIPWGAVPLYWLDSGRALTDAERLVALAEYRATGGMYLVVMAEPTGSDSPEECERLSEAGPSVDEIDWAGFDA